MAFYSNPPFSSLKVGTLNLSNLGIWHGIKYENKNLEARYDSVNGTYVAYKSRGKGAAQSSADQAEVGRISKSPLGGWCEPVDLPLSKQMPPGLRLPKHVQ